MPEPKTRLVSPVERLLHVQAAPLFGSLPPADLTVLARYARERTFAKGDALQRSGERAAVMHLIVEGSVRLDAPGSVPTVLGPRDALGVIGLLARAAEGVDATATEETLTLEIDAETLSDLVEDHFSILHHLLRAVARLSIDRRRAMSASAGFSGALRPAAELPTRPLDLVERIFFLRRTLPFETASVNALGELARRVEEVRLPPAHRLWSEDDPADSALLLVGGSVTCSTSSAQRFRFGPGGAVGALDSMAAAPRWYEATTESALVALRVRNRDLVDVLEDHFEMAMEVMAALARDALQRSWSPG